MDLSKHGLALRLRWEWLRRLVDRRPWQGLNLAPDKHVQRAFNSLVKWELGDGKRILFWKDRWVHGSMIGEIAPSLITKVKTRIINTRLVSEGLLQHDWTYDILGDFSTEELAQFIHLWEVLMQFDLTPGSGDKAYWAWHASGVYTAACAYRMFCIGGVSFSPAADIWKNGAPSLQDLYVAGCPISRVDVG
ncbi:putative ribonuclease H protein [Hordeum vulgare]|nr:putative ribonuclease H protein [Hordeum vulgare]